MEEQCDYQHWDEPTPDALGQIFSNLYLQEILTVIPCVCKSWRAVVMDPYCCQEIDIEEWSNGCQPDHLDRMLQMLVTRSSGSLRKLCVSGLQNDTIFSFVTDKQVQLPLTILVIAFACNVMSLVSFMTSFFLSLILVFLIY
ncbi:F-box protein FBW2 [Hibiscus syriacus]|uniref:F-box protein FBW2 n=1 Tax=Hibiscus syriacus TaxID=106335 RepID=A0A6A2X2I0_HIBSY|nr:F-box protein FBW2 [Hibiscus syriacus]